MKVDDRHASASRPVWTYSVQPPRILSPLWMLEQLARLSVPIAAIGVVAAARGLGLVAF